jgi:hypothetical protein
MERKRYVDAGRRIGHVKPKESESAKPFTFEEQERRLKARADGDQYLDQSRKFLADSWQAASFDEIPYIPGCWTPALHDKVVHLLEIANDNWKEAEAQYVIAGAKDKVSYPSYTFCLPLKLR